MATQPSGGCSSLDILMYTDGSGIHFFYCPGGSGEWTEQNYQGLRADAIAPTGACNESTAVYGILDGSFSKCLNGAWINTLGIYASSGVTHVNQQLNIDDLGGDGHRGMEIQSNTTVCQATSSGYLQICAIGSAGSEKMFTRVNGGNSKEMVDKDSVQLLENKSVAAPDGTGSLKVLFDEDNYLEVTVDGQGNALLDQTSVVPDPQFSVARQILAVRGLDANAHKITTLATCEDASDACPKSYIDGLIATPASAVTFEGQTACDAPTDADHFNLCVLDAGTVSLQRGDPVTPPAAVTLATTTYVPATANALAANGANCSAGSYPLGVTAAGAVESCTVAEAIGDSHKGTVVMWADGTEASYDTGTELCASRSLTCKQIAGTVAGILGTLVNCSTAQTNYFTAFCY